MEQIRDYISLEHLQTDSRRFRSPNERGLATSTPRRVWP